MNRELYWKVRKIFLKYIFTIKRILYRFLDFLSGYKEYSSFRGMVIRNTILGLLKVGIIIVITIFFDSMIISSNHLPIVDKNIFVPSIIGGISIAGVILGLYCANISSTYSIKYANAPRNIANAFQYDRLSRKSISGIVDYIIFGFLLICVTMFKNNISWIIVATFILWSIIMVVSYSIAGNRAHQLSDVYAVAADSYRILYRIFTKRLNHSLFSTDNNFQNHFMKVAEKQIGMLKAIQKYGAGVNKSDNADNSALTEFMINNLILIQTYWLNKAKIGQSSLWFRNTPKYQRWHLTNDTESSIALRTGTSLRAKEEKNYWWIEEELISINKSCLIYLFEREDYSSIYLYMTVLEQMCSKAIRSKEANIYVKHVDWIKQELEKRMISPEVNGGIRTAFAGLMEVISLLYLDLILESGKAYREYDVEKIAIEVIKAIDSGKDIDRIKYFCGTQETNFYKKIITEVQVENKRISPDWVIKQQIAKEEYIYLNSLLDIVREGMDHAFKLGQSLLEKKLFFEACIILTRFYEYESKFTHFLDIVGEQKDSLETYHIDKEHKWGDFKLQKLIDTMEDWKKSVPTLLFESSSQFALANWENRDEYPDFLGECYNHICEDSVEAIISGNINQFAIDFENLSKLMLLYQEYIRSDFIKNKDLYRIEYAYYMVTSPIVEWAQIGGLAILWGEFTSDDLWKQSVNRSSDSLFVKDGESTGLAEKLIEYVQQRDRFMLGIGGRDILETGWQQSVANAIRDRGICETEYEMFSSHLKTDSKLLKAFCSNFMDMGFMSDPSEVFWVLCVNPFMAEKNRFHTKYSWEAKLND